MTEPTQVQELLHIATIDVGQHTFWRLLNGESLHLFPFQSVQIFKAAEYPLSMKFFQCICIAAGLLILHHI